MIPMRTSSRIAGRLADHPGSIRHPHRLRRVFLYCSSPVGCRVQTAIARRTPGLHSCVICAHALLPWRAYSVAIVKSFSGPLSEQRRAPSSWGLLSILHCPRTSAGAGGSGASSSARALRRAAPTFPDGRRRQPRAGRPSLFAGLMGGSGSDCSSARGRFEADSPELAAEARAARTAPARLGGAASKRSQRDTRPRCGAAGARSGRAASRSAAARSSGSPRQPEPRVDLAREAGAAW